MSNELEELRQELAALRQEVAELRARHWDGRLGPQPPTREEVAEQTARFIKEVEVAIEESKAAPALCTTNGKPVAEVRASQTNETGQHDGYIVLCPDERAKGFVRPYRDRYKHLKCGSVTTMGRALSETYARDPRFYGATFCVSCNAHYPVVEFVWDADGEQVGS